MYVMGTHENGLTDVIQTAIPTFIRTLSFFIQTVKTDKTGWMLGTKPKSLGVVFFPHSRFVQLVDCHGVQCKMISVANFFVIVRLLFYALLLLFVT